MTYTIARKQLAGTMDRVCQDRIPVIITRKGAQPAVLLSLDEYEPNPMLKHGAIFKGASGTEPSHRRL